MSDEDRKGEMQDLQANLRFNLNQLDESFKTVLLFAFVDNKESVFNQLIPPDDQAEFLRKTYDLYLDVECLRDEFPDDPNEEESEGGFTWNDIVKGRLESLSCLPYLAELLTFKMPKGNQSGLEHLTEHANRVKIEPIDLAVALLRMSIRI